MKSSRADIRIVKLSEIETLGVIRDFVDSNNFVLEKDVMIDEKTTNIRAHNHVDSLLKFWWKGTPQVLDWKIIELGNMQTKIETRFGLLTKFTVWFWVVLIALCSPFILFMVKFDYKSLSITSFGFRASLLFVGAIFSLIIHSSYESLLHKQYKILSEKGRINNVLKIQSNCIHPLSYPIMYFWLFIAVVTLTLLFCVTNRIDPIALHGAIILTCLLILLYYLRKNV